jgi:sirohydrochlorin cobaltochelatase
MHRESDFKATWRDAALVIVGHGSASNPAGRRVTETHVEALAGRDLFAAVRAAFVKEAPTLAEVLAETRAAVVYVVPYLAYDGYIARTVIPRQAGLSGPVTERDGRRILLCAPVGSHPLIAEAVAGRIDRVMAADGLAATDTDVLLIAHGSERSDAGLRATAELGERLAGLGVACAIHAVFLEQAPRVSDWAAVTGAANVITVPLLMADGQHGAEDVPALLGLEGVMGDGDGADAAAGPYPAAGRRLWLCPPMGAEAVVVEAILARVAEADAAYGGG